MAGSVESAHSSTISVAERAASPFSPRFDSIAARFDQEARKFGCASIARRLASSTSSRRPRWK